VVSRVFCVVFSVSRVVLCVSRLFPVFPVYFPFLFPASSVFLVFLMFILGCFNQIRCI